MRRFAIALDGPAGSGKSTVAKAVAKKLGIVYVDTGAMYRAVAYYCMERGIHPADEAGVIGVLEEIQLRIQPGAEGQRIFLNGVDVTATIRTQAIGLGASEVAVFQSVRQKLGDMQKEMAKNHSLIMDGRDIGTYVLPQAEVKIYLDASVDQRSKRRMGELMEKGEEPHLETIREEIIKRDDNDMKRKYSPLCRAADAIFVDSTEMDIPAVVERILDIVEEKMK